ncbi:hypothetical protein ABTY20_19070 [Streptomyces sp. NPDC126497]|uniref:hypothetical protein n=1 Tax=Streptomyces sp. NPDC126497 TaxID=3155313 RepID=UPI00332A8FEF
MSTAALTVEDVVRRYAEDIAYVAEGSPAADPGTFTGQLGTAAERFEEAGVNGHEDVETAAVILNEVRNTDDEAARTALLGRAAELLRDVPDMADEYRTMV